jgi:hypothetical protein
LGSLFVLVYALLVSSFFFLSLNFRDSLFDVSWQLLFSAIAVLYALLSRRDLTHDAQAARFEGRNPKLPTEWHNLFDPGAERTFYYNSLTKTAQWEAPALLSGPGAAPSRLGTSGAMALYFLRGLFHPFTGVFIFLLTAGVYSGLLMAPCWCLMSFVKALLGGYQSRWVSLFSSICFLALPQPSTPVILGLAHFVPLSRIAADPLKPFLSLALLASLLLEALSFLKTLARAARARLPAHVFALPWDLRLQLELCCALCPALSWQFWPSAFRLSFDRVALLPLPFGVPLQVPVPKWELIGRSWTALLYAAPMVLPLARLIQTDLESVEPLKLADFCRLVLMSRPLQISVLVSVVTFVFRRQKEVYEAAIRDKNFKDNLGGADEATSLEDLVLQLLEDFDQRLGSERSKE